MLSSLYTAAYFEEVYYRDFLIKITILFTIRSQNKHIQQGAKMLTE